MTVKSKHNLWTGIHYYHPPRYCNRLLVIGIFGKLFYWNISNPEDKSSIINNG